MKLFPLELAKNTDELKRLISENPELPIVVLAGKLFNEGVLEIIKEVIPESGKTKYICKLKILDD